MASRMTGSERRRQLLDVSLQVFGQRGYHESSMDDIAEQAGITKPVVYQHFKNKESLYHELLTDVGNQLLTEVGAAVDGAMGASDKTEAGIYAFFRFVARNPSGFLMLFNSPNSSQNLVISARRDVIEQLVLGITNLIPDDFAPNQKRVIAFSLIGSTEWIARTTLVESKEAVDIKQLAKLTSSLAFGGLASVLPVDLEQSEDHREKLLNLVRHATKRD